MAITIPSGYTHPSTHPASMITGLATVATTGSYTDLKNTPYIESLPIGTVIAMAANYAPSGYVLCNGSAVSRSTYSDLFDKIGTTYGSGNGSTTFNLPNLTNKFIQGSGTAGTVKRAYVELPDHIHAFGDYYNNSGVFIATDGNTKAVTLMSPATYKRNWNGSGSNTGLTSVGTGTGAFDAELFTSLPVSSSTSSSVQPPAVTMRMYIKY